MNNLKFYTYLSFIITFFVACNTNKNDEKEILVCPELTEFINELNSNKVKLIKYISKDNKTDTLFIDSVKWKDELKMFTKYNLLKRKQSLYNISKNDCSFNYKSKEEKEELRNLKINKCDGQLFITYDIVKQSKIYEYLYHLEINKKGFLINAFQKVKFAFKSDFRIEGKFYK